MANLFDFTNDEQLIIILELSNHVLVKAISKVGVETEEQIREQTLNSIKDLIPNLSKPALEKLLTNIRKVQTNALNAAVDEFNANNS